ncbi:MAG: hypothetical protein HY785_26455 [Oscillatoriophycideae cyanobacterium NC_groundwater_1537_Pr4_S-0.65um_50_18]|nr:hypothetical protein [Oscillatoriophycideae cyanobacterium NC_groundwater_1537_Pr4_S-0.65um_50_18]
MLPGAALGGSSAFYLFPDWSALSASHQNYQKLAQDPNSTLRDLAIAEAAENRHRLNCFAEGIGVLLGGIILSIGVHGVCTLPHPASQPAPDRSPRNL